MGADAPWFFFTEDSIGKGPASILLEPRPDRAGLSDVLKASGVAEPLY